MLYTVGEMAKALGVSASALRYYDQQGLLPFMERSSGGIRMFSDKDYEVLKIIECLKKSGLSIKEIKRFIDMAGQGDETLPDRLALFQSRREIVKKQLAEMQEALSILELKCWYYEQAVSEGTEERVKDLTVDDLPEKFRTVKEKICLPVDIRRNNDLPIQ